MGALSMEELTAYCSRYGFLFQGSGLYGGLANTWDYGPLGTRLKNQVKDAWRKFFIQQRENSFELDAGILMNPAVWKASGHLDNFSDPLVDCRACKTRHRADSLIADFAPGADADGMTTEEMEEYIGEHRIPCPNCGKSDFTPIRQFNLMFETKRGVTEGSAGAVYLRPENAQGEYVNFPNVLRTMRAKLPFGIGQIGKAFRNEITPKNFTFRTVEFEQMEYQTFCRKGDDERLYEEFKELGMRFFESLGICSGHLRFCDHEKLAHYAKAACDIEYLFPFGWGEINGTHNRTDFDLSRHQQHSGKSMEYFDPDTREKFIPYVVESTYGLDRVVLALLFENLCPEELEAGEIREVLRIRPALAPYRAAVLPLIKKKHGEAARKLYAELAKEDMVSYDETGTIGKRYRRADAVGTPFAVTVDDETLSSGRVTVRERDSMRQESVEVSGLAAYLKERIR